jgi:ABC-type Fe3+ transport system permease subunit
MGNSFVIMSTNVIGSAVLVFSTIFANVVVILFGGRWRAEMLLGISSVSTFAHLMLAVVLGVAGARAHVTTQLEQRARAQRIRAWRARRDVEEPVAVAEILPTADAVVLP